MTKPESYYCDICGEEISKVCCDRQIYVRTSCEWTEGVPCKEHIDTMRIDICDECLLKSTNIICGFRGAGIRIV